MLAHLANFRQLLLAFATILSASLLSLDVARADWSGGITGSRPNMGNVASGATGDTIFEIAPSTGSITKISGLGSRVSSGSSQVTVTIACGNPGACNKHPLQVTVTATGTPTGRARAMTAFTVAAGTASLSNINGSGTGTLTFTVGPIGKNNSKTFHLGMRFPIAGNNAAKPTGAAQSQFLVSVKPPGNTPAINLVGTGQANVFRSLSLEKNSDLAFGRIVKPTSGSGVVTINHATGLRNLSGAVVALATPSPSRATYTVTGEGGQTVAIGIPTSMQMSGPAGATITVELYNNVTTNANFQGGGVATLTSILGEEGAYNFGVGGSIGVNSSTPSGSYSGVFQVTVDYN